MFAVLHVRWQVLGALLAVLVLAGGCLVVPETTDGTDGANGATDDTTVANHAPVADAGTDQPATAGEQVVLDGTGSTDADGDRLAFIWRQVGGEPTVALADAFSSRPSFFVPADVPEETVLTFRLTVHDGLASDLDEVAVTVTP
jgi:hypothetical protein